MPSARRQSYYRRMRARLGALAAITAAAHKLVRVIFHLLTTHQAYDETVFTRREEQTRTRTEAMLRSKANAPGLEGEDDAARFLLRFSNRILRTQNHSV